MYRYASHRQINPTLKLMVSLLLMPMIGVVCCQQEETWSKTFGGSGKDEGKDVQQTIDGGYIVAGWTDAHTSGGTDLWLMKIDKQGNGVWSKTFGKPGLNDGANSVKQTSDGGYIITGWTSSGDNGCGNNCVPLAGPDFVYDSCGKGWLIKTDSLGNLEWDRTFEGSCLNVGTSVQQTNDGGYIIPLDKNEGEKISTQLIKTKPNGITEWEKKFDDSRICEGGSVIQTLDSGYLIVFGSYENTSSGIESRIVRLDPKGNELWQRTIGDAGEHWPHSVWQTKDGGYIIAGDASSPTDLNGGDAWLLKLDSSGNKEWEKTLGGAKLDLAYSVQQTSDRGYILVGSTESYGSGNSDAWLVKTDSNGNIEWDKTFGGTERDWGNSVQQTKDGGYIVTGGTMSYGSVDTDLWLIKTDPKGNTKV